MIIRLPRESTLFLLLGFFLQFNIVPSVYGIPAARASDLIALLILAYYAACRGGYRRLSTLAPLVACPLIALTAVLLKQSPGPGDHYNGLIFTIYLLIAVEALRHDPDKLLTRFAIGTLIGFALSLVVLPMQVAGLPMLRELGLIVDTSRFDARSAAMALAKPGGIWSNGNETGHVYALVGAAAMFLSLRYRKPWIYPAYYLALLAAFSITLNRAGLIAATIGLAAWGIAFFNARTAMAACVVGMVASIALVAGLGGPLQALTDALATRFTSDDFLARNLAQRLDSFGAGLTILVQYPFGIGYSARANLMAYLTGGVQSPHNAFIAFGFQLGLMTTVLLAASTAAVLWARNSVHPYTLLSVLFGGPSLFFEELSINQPFMFLAASIMATAWWLLWRGARRPAPSIQPA